MLCWALLSPCIYMGDGNEDASVRACVWEDRLVEDGGKPKGKWLNTYPVRPHLLQTEPYYCTTLLLKERPAPERFGHSSLAQKENKYTFLRKKRAFSILPHRESGHHFPSALLPLQHHHSEPAARRVRLPAASFTGTGDPEQ